jgi:hypothetical protein
MGGRQSRPKPRPPPARYNHAAAINLIGSNNPNNEVKKAIKDYQDFRDQFIRDYTPYSKEDLTQIQLKTIYK